MANLFCQTTYSYESEVKMIVSSVEKRIKWVDVYKGIMIILVVIGHATGRFNWWIYQFHMAAFFFVSGYTSSVQKRRFTEYIVKKIISIMFPYYFISILSFGINYVLSKIGVFDLLFGYSFLGIRLSLHELFTKGDIYSQYLGTFWFLAALFSVEVIICILIKLNDNQVNIVIPFIAFCAYILAYYLAKKNCNIRWSFFDAVIVSLMLLFYVLGLYTREYRIIEKCFGNKKELTSLVLFVCAVMISLWGKINHITVNIVDHSVNKMMPETIIALADIIIIIIVSIFISERFRKISSFFILLGENTLGIMIFHFFYFKLVIVLYYVCGLITYDDVKSIVLPSDSPFLLWLPLTIVSILGSLILWIIVKKMPIIRILVGQDRGFIASCVNITNIELIKKIENKFSSRIHEMWKSIYNLYVSQKKALTIFLILLVIVSLPFFRTGIILNDELQARALSMHGFKRFFITNFQSYLYDGRPLAAIINSFNMYVGFLGNGDIHLFKIMQLLTLLGEIVAFIVFSTRITRSREKGLLAGAIVLGTLPIVFEHMSPNAFVCLLGIPFILLLISLTLFVKSVDSRNVRILLLSMILFFISEMSYETFITYTLLYIIITFRDGVLYAKTRKTWVLAPILTSFIYIIIYYIGHKIFVSGYAGNQIAFTSIKESVSILANLFIVSLPGYFVFSSRYQGFKDLMYNLEYGDYVRIIIASIVIGILFFFLLQRIEKEKVSANNYIIASCAVLYMILPSLPIAVSSMYQGNVGLKGFLTLPLTHYEFFAAALALSIIIADLCSFLKGKLYIIFSLLFAILVFNVQEMNDIFSRVQADDYNKLVLMEEFIETDSVANLNGKIYLSPDMYMASHLLVIHDGFWTQYCVNKGLDLTLLKDENGDVDGGIFYDDDNFVIENDEETIVLSVDEEYKPKTIPTLSGEVRIFNFAEYNFDGHFYVYHESKD